MKRLVLACLLLLCTPAWAQFVPSLVGIMTSSDGTVWADVLTTSTTGAFPPSFTPSRIGVLCFNNSTHQWAPTGCFGTGSGDTITSPGGTINVGGTSVATTLDIDLAKANTWTNGMTIQNGLTVDTIAISADGVGMTFPQGSQIYEDTTDGLLMLDNKGGGVESNGGQLILGPMLGSISTNFGDGTNSANIFQVNTGGVPSTYIEATNNLSTAFFVANRNANNINAGNTNEAQIASGSVTSGGTVIPVFVPTFGVGDKIIALKGPVAYTPVVVNTNASQAMTSDSQQEYILGANTTFTAPTIYSGMHLSLQICQPASGGPFTATYPAALVGAWPPPTGASACIQQAFNSFDGTHLVAENNQVLSLTLTGTQTISSNLSIPVGSSLNTPIIRSQDGTAAATLSGGRWTFPGSGAASAPAAIFTGTPFTGGTGTTTFPDILIQPTGATAVTTWATTGTILGINTVSGWSGNLVDLFNNNAHEFIISAFGSANANHWGTINNCANAASPAACGSITMGSVAVPAGTNPTLVVDSTSITANSEVFLTPDQSLGTRLSVTCNTTVPTATVVTARTAAASFTFEAVGTFTTNPVCYNYAIYN
jgi:hypothetical protein